jgi:hypothetical protein
LPLLQVTVNFLFDPRIQLFDHCLTHGLAKLTVGKHQCFVSVPCFITYTIHEDHEDHEDHNDHNDHE